MPDKFASYSNGCAGSNRPSTFVSTGADLVVRCSARPRDSISASAVSSESNAWRSTLPLRRTFSVTRANATDQSAVCAVHSRPS